MRVLPVAGKENGLNGCKTHLNGGCEECHGAVSLPCMEPFSVTIGDRTYEVQPYARGYGVSFHITCGPSTIIFELDEEDNLRARSSGEPADAVLVGQLAEAITRHYGGAQ